MIDLTKAKESELVLGIERRCTFQYLDRTGQTGLAEALRTLDPSIR